MYLLNHKFCRARSLWRTHSPRAFTLIELLVVIAVVAVLSSISLPIISSVQQNARSTQCINNLRQLGVATVTYAGEHSQSLPDDQTNPNSSLQSVSILWPQLLWPYAYPNVKYTGYSGPAAPALFSHTIFECPQAGLDKNVVNVRSYGMNYFINDNNSMTPTRLTSIGRSSTTMLICDNYNGSIATYNSLANRHMNFCNTLFCDGHADHVVVTDAMKSASYSDPYWGVAAFQK